MQSDKHFTEDFTQFIYLRLESANFVEQSDDYRALKEKALYCYETIQAAFQENEELRKKLMDLADSYTGMQGESEKYSYKLGFEDGVKLMFSVLSGS